MFRSSTSFKIKSTNFSFYSLFPNPALFCPSICYIIFHASCYLPPYLLTSLFPPPHFFTSTQLLRPPNFLPFHIFAIFNRILLFLSPNSIFSLRFVVFLFFSLLLTFPCIWDEKCGKILSKKWETNLFGQEKAKENRIKLESIHKRC